jgi:hypothetical protein
MQEAAVAVLRQTGLQAVRLAQAVAEKVKEVTALPHKVQPIQAVAAAVAAHR